LLACDAGRHVVALGVRLARVIRTLLCLQLVNRIANEVSDAQAEGPFAASGQLLKCGSADTQVDCRLLTGEGACLEVGASYTARLAGRTFLRGWATGGFSICMGQLRHGSWLETHLDLVSPVAWSIS
jgi:hypothetical protein